jgi:hypothetical protein
VYVGTATLGLLLAGCGVGDSPADSDRAFGDISPQAVMQSFLEELNKAISDPQLADSTIRRRYVDRLASYFAPNERDDQRTALGDALGQLVAGQRQRTSEERRPLTLKLSVERVEKVSGDADRALVRPINARLVVVYLTDRGPEEGESIALEQLIGGAEIPVVRIGDRWFLSAG